MFSKLHLIPSGENKEEVFKFLEIVMENRSEKNRVYRNEYSLLIEARTSIDLVVDITAILSDFQYTLFYTIQDVEQDKYIKRKIVDSTIENEEVLSFGEGVLKYERPATSDAIFLFINKYVLKLNYVELKDNDLVFKRINETNLQTILGEEHYQEYLLNLTTLQTSEIKFNYSDILIELSKEQIHKACKTIVNDLGYSDLKSETIETEGWDDIEVLEYIDTLENPEEITDEKQKEINSNVFLASRLKEVIEELEA